MSDPRLDALLKFSLDAVTPGESDPAAAAIHEALREIRRRLDDIERTPTIQVVPGGPTGQARDGTAALDSSQPRLWLRRNGAWQYAPLT